MMDYFKYAHLAISVVVALLILLKKKDFKIFSWLIILFSFSYWLLNYPSWYFGIGFIFSFIFAININLSGVLESKKNFILDFFDIFSALLFCFVSIFFWSHLNAVSSLFGFLEKNKK